MVAMKTYTTGWWCFWTALSCLVAGAAFLAWPVEIGVLFVLSAAAGVIVALRRRRTAGSTAGAFPYVSHVGARAGVMFAAVIGGGRLGGTIVWPVLLIAVLSCPALVARLPRPSSDRRPPKRSRALTNKPAVLDVSEFKEFLDGVSDTQLCQAWYESFDLLQHPTANNRYSIVSYRQACLDELERRHPKEIHAWLESEPRPTANPAKFLKNE